MLPPSKGAHADKCVNTNDIRHTRMGKTHRSKTGSHLTRGGENSVDGEKKDMISTENGIREDGAGQTVTDDKMRNILRQRRRMSKS